MNTLIPTLKSFILALATGPWGYAYAGALLVLFLVGGWYFLSWVSEVDTGSPQGDLAGMPLSPTQAYSRSF